MMMKFTIEEANVEAELWNHDDGYQGELKHSGHLLTVDGVPLGIFKFKSRLFCFVGDRVGPREEFEFANVKEGDARLFTASHRGKKIFGKRYDMVVDYDTNPYWPTEEEDADPLLWISLILNSAERSAIVLSTCREPKTK